jgi:hypothetical protein
MKTYRLSIIALLALIGSAHPAMAVIFSPNPSYTLTGGLTIN